MSWMAQALLTLQIPGPTPEAVIKKALFLPLDEEHRRIENAHICKISD